MFDRKAYMKEYNLSWYEGNKETVKKAAAVWAKENPEKRKRISKKYYSSEKGKASSKVQFLKSPEKVKARVAARKLPKGGCSIEGCGVGGEKHHPNYSKPLEVVYLCHKHHKEEHRRINSG